MITSVFKKSTPLNYALVVFLVLIFFFTYEIQDDSWLNEPLLIAEKGFSLLLLLASIFLSSFIGKKNGMTKDSTFTALFYFLLLLFVPAVFSNMNLIIANFFVILALRRLLSLDSPLASKEKIFDASFWIIIASLLQFWCILFLFLVFIAIIFRVSRDYTNWILPFIALFAVGILFLVYTTSQNMDAINYILQNAKISYSLDYFENKSQNISFSIYVSVILFVLIATSLSLTKRLSNTHLPFKKMIAAFIIGIFVFLISSDKSNQLLLFTFSPLAIMASAHLEFVHEKIKKELMLGVLMLCSFILYLIQL